MAILLVDGRAVDWASCWTSNRIANQELLLEDVDGDGFVDVAFRAEKGMRGLQDKRQDRRAGDGRIWLYAYRITSKGLQPIFPVKEQVHRLKVENGNANQPVHFQMDGLPDRLFESEMYECVVSATNISKQTVQLTLDQFFPELVHAGGMMRIGSLGKEVSTILPGQTTSGKSFSAWEGTRIGSRCWTSKPK